MFIDSHCHLEMESFDEDRDAVIEACLREGLQYILTVGTEEVYFDTVIAIIEKYPAVFGALGIHPHNSNEFNSQMANKVRRYASHPRIVGYGEIGLDFFKDHSPRETQVSSFRAQLQLARELCLPVIVHSRNAKEETYAILRETCGNEARGVIHCYSYDQAFARKFLEMGFFISIPGTITYKNTEELMEVVRYVPVDRLLAETDAPFLTPHPYRGKRNLPYFVKLTTEKMAAIRGMDTEELSTAMTRNFRELFLNNQNPGVI